MRRRSLIAYRRKDVPAGLNYNQNPRAGDPVVIATGPYAIRAHKPQGDRPDQSAGAGDAWIRPAQECRR